MVFNSLSKIIRISFSPQSKNFAFFNDIKHNQHIPIFKTLAYGVYKTGSYDKLLSLGFKEKHQLSQKLFKKASLSFLNQEFEISLYYLTVAYGLFKPVSFVLFDQENLSAQSSMVLKEISAEEHKNSSLSEYQVKVENSLVFYVLTRIADCFNRLFNFEEAEDCLKEAEKLSNTDLKMLLLYTKNTLCDTAYDLDKLNRANSYLKRAKEIFSLTKSSFQPCKIQKIEEQIESLNKEIKKKRKQIEKRTRINLNQLIAKTIYKYNNRTNSTPSKNSFSLKTVNNVLDDIRDKYSQELKFYKQSKNKAFHEKTMKDYFEFMLVREELTFVLNLKCDLKNLKSCFKNKVLTIHSNKQSKEEFLNLFKQEKVLMVLSLFDKLRKGSLVAKEIQRESESEIILKMKIQELKVKSFERSYFCLLSTRDFSFLFIFGMMIALFAAFIANL